MDKEKLVQELTNLVKSKKHQTHLGMRIEVEGLPQQVRSKVIRAYVVDLFGDYTEVDGLHELEDAIDESIQ